MSAIRLAYQNLAGNLFRSGAVFLTAALVAGLALAATLVVRGAETALRSNLDRLGADIFVVPFGTITEQIGGVFITAIPTDNWMPRVYKDEIARLDGVTKVSPQLFLARLPGENYGLEGELFLVAFDPETDFTLQPWLPEPLARPLGMGEALVGSLVIPPPGKSTLQLYGMDLVIAGQLESTATQMDQGVFVSFETATELIDRSKLASAGAPINTTPQRASVFMVRSGLREDPHEVGLHILEEVKGVMPLDSTDLFQTQRGHMAGLIQTMLGLLGTTWLLAIVFVGLVFSIAANERRREIATLRALGAPQQFILKSLLSEGIMLALSGGASGVILAVAALYLLQGEIERAIALPFTLPAFWVVILLALGGLLLALLSVVLGALFPAWRISREEVSVAMRE